MGPSRDLQRRHRFRLRGQLQPLLGRAVREVVPRDDRFVGQALRDLPHRELQGSGHDRPRQPGQPPPDGDPVDNSNREGKGGPTTIEEKMGKIGMLTREIKEGENWVTLRVDSNSDPAVLIVFLLDATSENKSLKELRSKTSSAMSPSSTFNIPGLKK
ncbi:hypothetical protein Tsubulata_048049 [Turnera subulata]|uniref:Uncharacterized protein n=1 Tax=Turnera subulata TaxID=218843 RepID=A0A9Q0F0P2_9ROSI|nr:hypothetical protein Tsubulata_048049 [Turnera subulata]